MVGTLSPAQYATFPSLTGASTTGQLQSGALISNTASQLFVPVTVMLISVEEAMLLIVQLPPPLSTTVPEVELTLDPALTVTLTL